MQDDYSQDVQPDQYEDGGRKRHSEGQTNGRDAKRMNHGPKKPTLKILLQNFAIGKLIGKKGVNIHELESKHSAIISISPGKDFFPGTTNRAITISADIDQIIEFTRYIIETVLVEDTGRGPSYEEDFSLVITNPAVGLIIGKGGSTVKVIQEETGAVVSIQKHKESPSVGERLVKVIGSREQKVKAVEQIINKISVEPDSMSNPNTKYSSGDVDPQLHSNGGYAPRYGGGGVDYKSGYGGNVGVDYKSGYGGNIGVDYKSGYGGNVDVGSYDPSSYYKQKSKVKIAHIIEMQIPNAMVGTIVGKQGAMIKDFCHKSGALISFSGKEEFAPGTEDRILTIRGTKSQIHYAYTMIDQKVSEVEAEFRRSSYQ